MDSIKIRCDDQVVVIYGRDKGKRGRVLEVCKKKLIIVKDINIVHRHTKSTGKVSGGIIKKESPIHISNVALVDPKTDKATRVGFKFNKDGLKVRYSKISGEVL